MGTAPQNVIGKLGNPKGSIMSYPADIYNTPYASVLRFSKYSRDVSYKSGTQNPEAAIILPLPLQLAEAQGITHSDIETPYVGSFLSAASNLMQGGSAIEMLEKNLGLLANKGVSIVGSEIAKKFNQYASSAADTIAGKVVSNAAAAASNAFQDLSNLGARGAFTGQITNPHATVLFSGVQLRNFMYNWTFSPRSSQESRELNEIFTYIRRASLPAYIVGKIGLDYPMEVQVDFIGNGIEKFIIGTKRTIITDVQINYAADGHPSFYKDGAPTSLSLQITLKEVAIRTAEDYGGQSVQPVDLTS